MFDAAPDDWRQVVLSDLVKIVTAGISADELASKTEVHHYSLPAFDLKSGPEVGPGDAIKSNKSLVPNDCVLFSKLNPRIPRIWRVKKVASPDAYCSTEFWPLVRKSDDIDLDFLTYFLGSAAFLGDPAIVPSSSTNSHQRVDRRSFEAFVLRLPPVDEQRRIAEVLRSVDACLQAGAEEIGQLEGVRAATVARAFSTAAGHLPESQAGEGWKRVRLCDLFTQRKESGITGLPIASISIESGLVLRSSLDRRVESTLGDDEHSLVRKDDIAYNTMRMWQGACGLAEADCLVSPAYVVMTPSNAVLPRFALLMLRAPAVLKLLHAYSQGVVDDRLRLYPHAFGQIPLNLPPLEWQCGVVEEFAALDASLERARRAQERLLVVKAAVLNDLLSGRVRVPA